MSDNPQPTKGEQPQSELRTALDAGKKRRRNGLIAGISVVAVAAIAVSIAFAVGAFGGRPSGATADAGSGDAAPAERLSLKLAGSGESDFQDEIQVVAKEKGLDLEWVNFDDWTLPNSALVSGEVDGNAFQHIAFLSAFNVANDADLTPVFSTVITQWGIFSATIDDLADLKSGDRIAIPDDASNGGRALFILRDAGLIELADDAGTYPTVDDITANKLDLQLVPIAALTIPTQFDDPSLAAVVVGTSYFDPSQGISTDDALFLDDSLAESSLPYVNVVATRADNVDNPAWKVLEEVYQDERVADALEKEQFGNTVLVDVSVDKLRDKLADLEELARSLK